MADDLEFDAPSVDQFMDEDEVQQPAPKARQRPRRAPAPPAPVQQEEEYEEEEQLPPAPVQPARRPMMRPQSQLAPAPIAPVQQAQPAATPDAIVPYEIPKRIGFFNRNLNKAIVEDEDMLRVIMASQAEILNRLERIEAALS